jgi:hypothetical protein
VDGVLARILGVTGMVDRRLLRLEERAPGA